MSGFEFSIYILASTTALCAAYAFMMSLLQREINMLWIRGESVLLLLSSGIALKAGVEAISENMFARGAIGFLSISIVLSLGLVLYHRFILKHTPYPAEKVPKLKMLAMFLLTIHIVQVLSLLAGAAGF